MSKRGRIGHGRALGGSKVVFVGPSGKVFWSDNGVLKDE
jgi:hypothetical protein